MIATMKEEFHDINQLPQDEGLLIFGISMSRIGNAQSAESCLGYIKHMGTKINRTEGIGAVFLYGDYLYFHSSESAKSLRDRYSELMMAHKNGFLNALFKDDKSWIKKAFSFYTFGQTMLDNSEIFTSALTKVRSLYESDEVFREYVDEDRVSANKESNEAGITFILEEITFFYLAAKGELTFNNRFVANTERWILQCYPGKPLKSETYLFQKNPLQLSNPKNKYENSFYDLEGKKLYDYLEIDLTSSIL
jgi:hypothetical protein